MLNRPPREALDGVGTFWELNRSAVSLFTYRFADVASADREYQRLTAVLDNCRDVPVEVHARPASRGMLTVTPLTLDASAPPQIAYVLTTNDGTKLAVNVLAFENTSQLAVPIRAGPRYLPATDSSARHGLAYRSDARRARPASLGPGGIRIPNLELLQTCARCSDFLYLASLSTKMHSFAAYESVILAREFRRWVGVGSG